MALNSASFKTSNPLADYSAQIVNAAEEYIAMQIFRPVMVPKSIGFFYQYDRSNLLSKNTTTVYGAEAPKHEHSVFTSSFACELHALKFSVLGSNLRDFDAAVADLNREAVEQNMHALLLELEVAAATKAMTSSNYPAALAKTLTSGGGADSGQWIDADADIVKQIDVGRLAVKDQCGFLANKLAISDATYHALKRHPQFREFFQYTQPVFAKQALAAALGLDDILVGSARKNTANVNQTASISSVWDDDALLFYGNNSSSGLRTMEYGKLFMVEDLKTFQIDLPEVGHGLPAHDIETAWEWALNAGAVVSGSDGDFIAGYLFTDAI